MNVSCKALDGLNMTFKKKIFLIFAMCFFSFYFALSDFYKTIPYLILFIAIFYKLYSGIKLDIKIILFCFFVIVSPIFGDLINIFYRDVTPLSSIEKVIRNIVLILPIAVILKLEDDYSFHAFLILLGVLFVTMVASILQYNGFYAVENTYIYGNRIGLWWNPIPFSNAVVFILAVFSGVFMVLISHESTYKKNLQICFFLGFISAGVVISLSGTRGSLIGYLFIFMCVYNFLLMQFFQNRVHRVFGLLLMFFIIILSLYFVRDGFALAYSEFLRHFLIGSEPSSISIRLTMWDFSIFAFKEHVFLGLGIDKILPLKESLIEKGYYPDYLILYHTHSDILDSMLRSGLIGLIGIVLLYMSPLVASKYFGCRIRQFLPLSILTCVAFIMGVFDTPLRNNVSVNSFYICYFIILYVCLKNLNKAKVV